MSHMAAIAHTRLLFEGFCRPTPPQFFGLLLQHDLTYLIHISYKIKPLGKVKDEGKLFVLNKLVNP